MNEEITLRLETFNDKEYILADECIKAISIHRKTNTKLHKEIESLKEEYVMLQNASDEVEEEKDKEIEKLNNRVSELEKVVSRKEEQITDLDDENFDLENEIERLNNIIEKYKKHLEDIDKWLDYNTEIGNLYWYDSTPFPELEIDGSDKE